MSSNRFARALVLGTVAVALATGNAFGQTPNAAEIGLAREQSRAGMEAARAGRWSDALHSFTRSFELYPRPLTLLNLAGAQAQTGHLVQAMESYRRFLHDATEGPAAEHRAEAQAALDQIAPRIARVRISADGLAPDDQLSLDGERLSRAVVGAEISVDPGNHVLVITRGGVEVARGSVSAIERGHHQLSLRVVAAVATANAGTGNSATPNNGVVGTGSGASSPTGTGSDRTNAWAGTDALPPRPPPTGGGGGGAAALWVTLGILAAGGAAVGVYFAVTSSTPAPFAGNVAPGMWTIR